MKTDGKQEQQRKRIYVESLDGEAYTGDTFADVVRDMRATAWGGEQSDGIRGYMKQVSKRIWDWSQKQIRINSPENFLRDMQREGLLRMQVKP